MATDTIVKNQTAEFAPPYRRSEVAQILKMSASQVSKLIRKGRLRAVQTGFGKVRQHVRITSEALEEFLRQNS
jgi:excisionase family DNA binding protein